LKGETGQQDLQLPVVGVYKTLAEQQVLNMTRLDAGNAPAVPLDLDRTPGSVQLERIFFESHAHRIED
jgi:hypothetical protein